MADSNRYLFLSVDNLTVTDLYLQKSIQGDIVISGTLTVLQEARFDANVKLNKNMDVSANIIANTITARTLLQTEDILVNGNLLVKGENLMAFQHVDICGNLGVYNQLQFGNTNAYMYSNTGQNIGINTMNASAILDISGDNSRSINVYTSQSKNTNILARNNQNKGITTFANSSTSHIGFYNNRNISEENMASENTPTPDAKIQYSASGVLIIDVSVNTNINSRTSIAPVIKNTPHVMDETLTVFGNASTTPYLWNSLENNNILTSTVETLVSYDNSTNAFLNIVTPNKQGIAIGGGRYAKDSSRSIGTIGTVNSQGVYYPSLNIVSGNNRVKHKFTVGINTHTPSIDKYSADINGPLRLTNGETTVSHRANFEIRRMYFPRTHPNCGIAIGSSISTSSPYYHTLLYTRDGGNSWAINNLNIGTIFNTINTFYDTYMVDSSLALIVGTNGKMLYSNNGGAPVGTDNRWNSILLSLNETLRTVFVNSSLRFFASTATTVYWFSLPGDFDIYTSNEGIVFTDMEQRGVFTVNDVTNITQMRGYNDNLYIISNNAIVKYTDINTPFINFAYKRVAPYGTYRSLSVLNDNTVVAVGANIISYTNDGVTWTDISIEYTLNSVFMYSSTASISVGNGGTVMYSTNGNQTWSLITQIVPASSSNFSPLVDASYNLTNVVMDSKNSFLVSKLIVPFNEVNGQKGNTSIMYTYLPYMFNNENNSVLDISGAVCMSGDLNIDTYGKINSTNDTFYLLNSRVNTLYMANDASSIVLGNSTMSTVTANYNLTVLNDSSLNRHLRVGGNATILGNAEVGDSLLVNGDATLNSNLYVNDNTYLYNKLFAANDVSFGANLLVYGDTSLNGLLRVDGNTQLNQQLNVAGDASMNSRLLVVGDVSLNSNTFVRNILRVDGNTQLNQRLNVVSDVSMGGNLLVYGDTSLNGLLRVDGNTQLNQQLNVAGDASMNSRLLVIGDVSLNSNTFVRNILRVDGNTQLNQQLNVVSDVSMGANLLVYGDTSLNGLLRVDGNTQLNQQLNVVGDASMNSRLLVIGDVSLNSNTFVRNILRVDGNTQLNRHLNVVSDVSMGANVIVARDTSLNGLLRVDGNTQLNQRLNVVGDASMNSRLLVVGDVSFNNNAVVRNVLRVDGNTQLNQRLNVVSDVSMGANVIVARDTSLNGLLRVDGNTQLNQQLNVAGDVSLNSQLLVVGDVSMNSGMIVVGDVSLNSRFVVAGDVSLNSTLRVGEDSTFYTKMLVQGDVSLNSNAVVRNILRVDGNTQLNQRLNVVGDVSMGANVIVGRDTSLNGLLRVDGNTQLNQRLNVVGDASMNSRLLVVGDVSFNNNAVVRNVLRVDGSTQLNQRLNVVGDVSMGGNIIITRDASFNSNVFVDGTVQIAKKTTMVDDVSMSAKLFVAQDASFNANLYISGNTTIDKRLTVNGNVAVNANLTVANNAEITGNLTVNKSAIFTQTIQTNSDLTVNSNAYISKSATIIGDATIGGNISATNATFTGNATINNNITVANKLTVNDASFTSNISVAKNITTGGELNVLQSATIVQNLYTNGDASLNGNLFVKQNQTNTGNVAVSGRIKSQFYDSVADASDIYIGSSGVYVAGGVPPQRTIFIGCTNGPQNSQNTIRIGGGDDAVIIGGSQGVGIENINAGKTLRLNNVGNESAEGAGIEIKDLSTTAAAYIKVSIGKGGYDIKTPSTTNAVKLDVSALILDTNNTSKFLSLTRSSSEAATNYTIGVGPYDVSNILVKRYTNADATSNIQVIDTSLGVLGNAYVLRNLAIGKTTATVNTALDISGNVTMNTGYIWQF
jgi:predicted acyltransferase (DUF342 family)